MSQKFNQEIKNRTVKLDQILEKVNEKMNHIVKEADIMNKYKMMFKKYQPKNLMGGSLKGYQLEALTWMIELSYRQMNGILADDMGLGKTIQTIAYLAYLFQEHDIKGKHMIIAPLTVLKNWEREFKKWLPSLKVVILWATQTEREYTLKTVVKPRDFDVLLTSYQGSVSAVGVLKRLTWETMTIDEAHKIKNDEAILTETVKEYKANFKLLLTGTPLSNNLRELWSLLNFTMPDIFYNRSVFDDIQQGVKAQNISEEQKFKIQCEIAKKFHKIIKPFLMRRTKQNTDLGLPPKTQKTLFVGMTKLQLKMYKNFLKFKNVYGRHSKVLESGQMVTRKICNHPYLFPGIEAEDSPQYGEHIIEKGGKMLVLDKLLKKLINKEKKKVLLFSQFKIQLNILEDYCVYRKYGYFRLDGNSTIDEREEMMDNFNNDENYEFPIFMLSTRAGGLGINLVPASIVIIFDIDWNPQNDNQAMDRAYRIGQTKPVHVFKLVTEHTIEERMLEVQKYKMIWDQLVIQKGTMIGMNNQDIMADLNYEKLVSLKKGDIFKLQANQDHRTIEEIIAMGEEKDEKKYKAIKEKINEQIQDQKNKEGEFVANPFEDKEYEDEAGDQILASFNGEMVNDNRKGTKQNPILKKGEINKDAEIQHFHFYGDEDYYQEMIKSSRILTAQLNDSDQKDEDIGKKEKELEKITEEIRKMDKKAFTSWTLREFRLFVKMEEKLCHYSEKNIDSLKKQLPTKSIAQITAYKRQFYSSVKKNLQFQKIRKEVLRTQQRNLKSKQQEELFKSIRDCQIPARKTRSDGPLISHLNTLRVSNNFMHKNDFVNSDVIQKDTICSNLEGILLFEDTVSVKKNNVMTFCQLKGKFTEKNVFYAKQQRKKYESQRDALYLKLATKYVSKE